MPWGYIVPSLILGGFIGWLAGVIRGHAETQERIEASERRTVALLTELHWSLRDRVEMMDVLVGIANDPRNAHQYAASWADLRKRLVDDVEGEGARFFRKKDEL